MYHPACWIVFTATTALLFIPGSAKSFFSGDGRVLAGREGKPSSGRPGLHAHCAPPLTCRQAASRSAAGNCQVPPASAVQTAVAVPRGRVGPPAGGRVMPALVVVVGPDCTAAPGLGRVRPLGQPLAVNVGVREPFPLQSWAPPVFYLSPELSCYCPCSPSSCIPDSCQANSGACPCSLWQSENEPPHPGSWGGGGPCRLVVRVPQPP